MRCYNLATQSLRPIVGSKQNLMFYICICKSMDYELEEKLYYDRSMCEHTMSICMHNYLLTYAYVAIATVDCTFCSITLNAHSVSNRHHTCTTC